jgi:hypothetical protein
MKQVKWDYSKGVFTITASDGRKRTLDSHQEQVDFMQRLAELEKFWNEKIVALETNYFSR